MATDPQRDPYRTVTYKCRAMFASDEHPFLTPDGWVPVSDLAGRYLQLGRPTEVVASSRNALDEPPSLNRRNWTFHSPTQAIENV
jgi:hypothetical protein